MNVITFFKAVGNALSGLVLPDNAQSQQDRTDPAGFNQAGNTLAQQVWGASTRDLTTQNPWSANQPPNAQAGKVNNLGDSATADRRRFLYGSPSQPPQQPNGAEFRDQFLSVHKAQTAPSVFKRASEALGLRHTNDPRTLDRRQ